MEFDAVVSLISSVGFPIVCCFFMWRYINTTLKDFNTTMTENTKMIALLCQKLETGYVDDDIRKNVS